MQWQRRAFAALLALSAGAAQALGVDELVDKYLAARGGLDKIHALKSVKLTGTMAFTGHFAIELGLSQWIAKPGLMRSDVSLQGMTAVQAWDGKEAWQISPFQGRKDPEKMSADDAKWLIEEADLEGPLVDWQAKGHKLEYLGTEDVDGTEAHALKVTLKSGDSQRVYLDPDHYLPIRITYTRTVRGVEQESEADLGSYERVAGVYFPFALEMGPKGGVKNQKITIAKAEANVAVDAAQFAFPAAK